MVHIKNNAYFQAEVQCIGLWRVVNVYFLNKANIL